MLVIILVHSLSTYEVVRNFFSDFFNWLLYTVVYGNLIVSGLNPYKAAPVYLTGVGNSSVA